MEWTSLDEIRRLKGGAVVGVDADTAAYVLACCEAHDSLLRERDELRAALERIVTFAGKTLLGYGTFEEGAAEAFNQAASLASSALSPSTPDGGKGGAK